MVARTSPYSLTTNKDKNNVLKLTTGNTTEGTPIYHYMQRLYEKKSVAKTYSIIWNRDKI